jgi:FkbM family methyltransferase
MPIKKEIKKARQKIYSYLFKKIFNFFYNNNRDIIFDALPAGISVANSNKNNYLFYSDDRVIGRSLFKTGEYDFNKLELALKLIGRERSADVLMLYDVGANIGTISLHALKLGLIQKAKCFEPDHENYKLLKANSIINEIEDMVELHELALGSERGQIQLYLSETSNRGDHRPMPLGGKISGRNSLNVDVAILDDFYQEDFKKRDLVWVDVQGFEGFVLKGAQIFIRNQTPLVLEVWPRGMKNSGSYLDFLKVIKNSRYKCFYILDGQSSENCKCLPASNIEDFCAEIVGNDHKDILLL